MHSAVLGTPIEGGRSCTDLSVQHYGSSKQMCSAVLGTPIEVNRESRASTASSLFLAADEDSGRPVKKTPLLAHGKWGLSIDSALELTSL